MTKRTECDRCHTTIQGGNAEITLNGPRPFSIPEELDLCGLCSATLLRWIKAGPTDAELHAGAQV